jgi:cytidine deaminase
MTDRELVQKAVEMQNFSYCPYSNFPVGAALLCEDGTVFTGCNVESAAYGSTICAERTALLKAVSEGHRDDWVTMAVAGRGENFCWPCGSCRQMLYEFAPEVRILAVRGDGTFEEAKLSDLLPRGFGAANLK